MNIVARSLSTLLVRVLSTLLVIEQVRCEHDEVRKVFPVEFPDLFVWVRLIVHFFLWAVATRLKFWVMC